MNLNVLFDILTNFKIKFTEYPTPTQVSNMNLKFIVEAPMIKYFRAEKPDVYTNRELFLQSIRLSKNKNKNEVEIVLIELEPGADG